MLAPRWRKVVRDVAENKVRTGLVVLSIAVGVFAAGAISGGRAMLGEGLEQTYVALNAADGEIGLRPFDPELTGQALGVPGVAEAEGRRLVLARMGVGPDRWRDLRLYAIPDFRAIRLQRILPESGAWPPAQRTMLVERSAYAALGMRPGERVLAEMPSGLRREIEVVGAVRDLDRAPIALTGRVIGYVGMETLEWLGEPRRVDTVYISVRDGVADRRHVDQVVEEVADRYRESGLTVERTASYAASDFWARSIVDSMVQLLAMLGFVVVLMSGFLVVNTITALLAGQVRQVGVMKAIGATARQTATMYLAIVALFGIGALLVAVPLGALASVGLATYSAGLLNLDVAPFRLPATTVALELLAGLVVPLAAALYPVVAGSRITVREAIASQGLGDAGGPAWLRWLLARRLGLSRPAAISLRNTFRRTGRLSLTLATLALSGAVFIATLGVREAMLGEIGKIYAASSYDLGVAFDGGYPAEQVARIARSVPDVVAVQSWPVMSAFRVVDRKGTGRPFRLEAPPLDSGRFRPIVLEGRALLPADENAILVNTDFGQHNPGVGVGSDVEVELAGVRRPWRVVGVVRGLLDGDAAYVNPAYLARIAGDAGLATNVRVVTAQHDPAAARAALASLEERLKSAEVRIASTWTIAQQRATQAGTFGIVVGFLLGMTLLLALVGGLGLMGTLSINVLERTREIGVMRAIGASDGTILRLVVGEGTVVALASWPLAVLLSVPLQAALSGIVADFFLKGPLTTGSGPGGAFVWLAVVLALSAGASYLPARGAARITVRDALAYG